MDKNKAIIEYISQCPQIKDNPLFFNYIKAEDNNKQIVTVDNDIASEKEYIDGSVAKKYTFSIIDFRSVNYNPLVKIEGYDNENVDEMLDVQSIIDWINTQNDNRNFPNFGSDCIIDEIGCTTDTPRLNGVDTTITPALVKYSLTIVVKYLDISKQLWK